ncbi:MAG: NAD-binding protein, partial [Saprospiraceae bacterium]
VEPLSDDAKIFTAFLILFSIFIFAYSVTTISAYLVTINSVFNFNQKKMENSINKLKGHVIICGYGRNGKQAAKKLLSYKRDIVVIEEEEDAIKELEEDGILYIDGNATEDESLVKAGIKNADFLITTLPSDTDNVFITLSSKQMNKKMLVVSRASEESSIKKLKIAGADNIIMPDKIGGDHMASLIVAPDLLEFLDNLSVSASGSINIQEIMLTNMPEIKTIDELKIKEKTGCTIIGYKTKSGNYIINPDHIMPVGQEGRIIVLGNTAQILKLNQVFNIN